MFRPRMAATALVLAATIAGSTPAGAQEPVEPGLRRVTGSEGVIDDAAISPDGRWLAFDLEETDSGTSIWIVSTDGGKPIRLTHGHFTDRQPRWFPNSARIAFASNRNASAEYEFHPWAVEFDPQTGTAEDLQQIGIEAIASPGTALAVSSDGEWIAYASQKSSSFELRIAPVVGGRSRLLATHPDFLHQLRWTPADDSLVYAQIAQDWRHVVTRISASGGEPEILFEGKGGIQIESDGRSLCQFAARNPDGSATWRRLSLDGTEQGSFRVADRLQLRRVRSDGLIAAIRSDRGAPVKVRSVLGGAARQLTESSRYHFVFDWSVDGERVLMNATLGDEQLLVEMSPATGAYEVVRSSPGGGLPRYSADGQSLLLMEDGGAAGYRRLVRWRPGVMQPEILSDSIPRWHNYIQAITGRGGVEFRDGTQDLSVTMNRDSSILVSAHPPDVPARLIASIPSEEFSGVAVNDSIIAYTTSEAGQSVVHVGVGWREDLDSIPLPESTLAATLSWSNGGDALAILRYGSDGMLANVATWEGETLQLGRWRLLPAKVALFMRWTHDDRGIVLSTVGGESNDDTSLLFVPIDAEMSTVDLTEDETGRIYSFAISPVDDEMAYAPEMSLGSSIWLLTLP